MKEVLAFEAIIRAALPRAREEAPDHLVRDADAIMKGKPTEIVGSRKERLRFLAEQLKPYCA
jgi:hypothetical protein